jgi:hypothetical protein
MVARQCCVKIKLNVQSVKLTGHFDKDFVNVMVYLHQDSLASMKRYVMIFVNVLDQH